MAKKTQVRFPTGSYVFQEGDPGEDAYLIESGLVQIFISKGSEKVPLAVLGPGDIFGEMAILDGMPRSASAYVVEEARVSVVSRQQIKKRIEESDPVVRLLIVIMLRRLRSSHESLAGRGKHDQLQVIPPPSKEAVERVRLEAELLEAIDRKEFFLEYQPIVDLETQDLKGFEALIRWQSPSMGLVAPDFFIELAEHTSLIIPIGAWVIKEAFAGLSELQQKLKNPDLYMSINVSSRQLNDPGFVKALRANHEELDINPRNIKLEVTERVFQEGPVIMETVDACRRMGYSISLDDFGTGYSSLTSLFNMNVDNIKIDRGFVSTILRDRKSKTIVQALINMSKGLGMDIIAEGIESHHEAFVLKGMGCRFGQGYLFGRPQTIARITEKTNKTKRVA